LRKARFYSQACDKHFETGRIIGTFHGKEDGPVLVFFGGIHGNESAGVVALIQVMEEIKRMEPAINGSIYAIAGNLNALEKNIRYEKEDLNRAWTKERIRKLEKQEVDLELSNADVKEQMELFELGKEIFKKHEHQVYCIDLHTTSAPTVPFITLNDTLINRQFATKFPVPVIIGIEEFLVGPLLSWVMELGYPSLAFEAGEHYHPDSIKYHKAFVWLSLVHGGLISEDKALEFDKHHLTLAASNTNMQKVFEVRHREAVKAEDVFKMNSGYSNLQPVQKGEALAVNAKGQVLAKEAGRIFMPLYQDQGDDGFFLIREVSNVWLNLSAVLRRWKFENLLPILPGVNRSEKDKHTLVVNKRVARFLTVEIFHLLGYRTKQRLENEIRVTRREYDVRGVAKKQ
jgi:predicted deacylase